MTPGAQPPGVVLLCGVHTYYPRGVMHQLAELAVGGHILVVDDTKLNIDILVDILKDSYTLSVATSGPKALAQALQSPPDLVLLDIMMPGMDGYEVCRRLKESEATRDIPVIFITALSDSRAVVQGLTCGAVDYITKPMDPAEVRARVRTHLSLLKARRDLEHKTRELQASNKRLQELDDIKSSFLSAVAHELRTPLTSILGFAKLVRKDFHRSFLGLTVGNPALQSKGRRIEENLAVISEEGARLSRMINDVLDLTKIESGRVQWRDEPFTLEPVARLAVKAVQGLVQLKPDLVLLVDLAEGLPRIVADRDRVEQVLINLLHNAIKFTEKGQVLLQARHTEAGGLRVSVQDTGVGIPPEEIERVFNKFHQVISDDTLPATKHKGTGLGLPICKQIVEHYGGRIWAESTPGQGTRMTFELPPTTLTTLPQGRQAEPSAA